MHASFSLPSRQRRSVTRAARRQLTLGIVLDFGFVSAYGAATSALSAAALAVARANEIFEQQIGVRLVLSHAIVNTQFSAGVQAETVCADALRASTSLSDRRATAP
eukprot:6197990-Pleurochrysis_carterae.AAC.8